MTDAAPDALVPSDRPALRGRLALLFTLAWPVILTRAGILTMALADIVMVGRYDADELAYAALGSSIFVVVLVTGVGLNIGVLTLSSKAYGAGDTRECGAILRRGLPWAAALGLVGGLVVAGGELWFRALGHDDALAREGGAVALALALGIPGGLLHVVCSFHLESTRRPRPGLWAMAAANLLNILLNYLLIYGAFGAPELGAVGSAIATAAVRTALFLALAAYILTRPDRADYGLDRWKRPATRAWASGALWGPGGWPAGREMRRLGVSSGVALGLETTAFFALFQMAGLLGAPVLAAFAIAHNVEAVLFMAALGVGSATAVLVGNALGAGDRPGAAAAGWTGLGAVLVAMTATAALLIALPGGVSGLYTTDPALKAAAAALIPWVGLLVLLDAAQIVMAQANRATGDAWPVTVRAAAAFWGVSVPSAYLFAIGLEGGAIGLLLGASCGAGVSLALQAARFRALTAREEIA